jgi:hypothetical protein
MDHNLILTDYFALEAGHQSVLLRPCVVGRGTVVDCRTLPYVVNQYPIAIRQLQRIAFGFVGNIFMHILY